MNKIEKEPDNREWKTSPPKKIQEKEKQLASFQNKCPAFLFGMSQDKPPLSKSKSISYYFFLYYPQTKKEK